LKGWVINLVLQARFIFYIKFKHSHHRQIKRLEILFLSWPRIWIPDSAISFPQNLKTVGKINGILEHLFFLKIVKGSDKQPYLSSNLLNTFLENVNFIKTYSLKFLLVALKRQYFLDYISTESFFPLRSAKLWTKLALLCHFCESLLKYCKAEEDGGLTVCHHKQFGWWPQQLTRPVGG